MNIHNNTQRIAFLDFMRIIAFIGVVIGHKGMPNLGTFLNDPSMPATLIYMVRYVALFCESGAAPVAIFFFTSGYIITHVLQSESPGEFAIKRAFRIYPLFVFVVLAEALMRFFVDSTPILPLSILAPQLLLVGDLFGTPYALAGVEWTLRIEIAFYAFMAVAKTVGLMRSSIWLLCAFVLATVALATISPFPNFVGAFYGYLTSFGPFLFIGSIIYLAERKLVCGKLCLLSIAFIFVICLFSIAEDQPRFKDSQFPILALTIFGAAWMFRKHLTAGPIVRLLSGLTYAVYLLHNWLWTYIDQVMTAFGLPGEYREIQIFTIVLAAAYLLHITVEQYGIGLGRTAIHKLRAFRFNQAPVSETATEAEINRSFPA